MSDPYRYPYTAPAGTDTQLDCPHVAPRSCHLCDGTAADQRAVNRGADEHLAQVRQQMRRSRDYRRNWLLSLPAAYRADMAAFADRTHGAMPGLLAEIEETRGHQA